MDKLKQNKKIIWVICVILIIAAVAWYVSAKQFQLMLIQGTSMEPTYGNLALVVLDKREDVYRSGDIIAFRCEGVKGVLVKRVVAEPFDSVYINEGKLYVNGRISSHMMQDGIDYAGIAQHSIELKENEYFVLGDNYKESRDSRYSEIGLVDGRRIIGKVIR